MRVQRTGKAQPHLDLCENKKDEQREALLVIRSPWVGTNLVTTAANLPSSSCSSTAIKAKSGKQKVVEL
jgi:hypothetical protein